MRLRCRPALRICEKELHCRCVALGSGLDRIVVADVGADAHDGSLDRPVRGRLARPQRDTVSAQRHLDLLKVLVAVTERL